MDNSQIPVQPLGQPMPQPTQPVQTGQPVPQPGQPVQPMAQSGQQMYVAQSNMAGVSPLVSPQALQDALDSKEKKSHSGLIKTIFIVILSLTTVTFVGLFIWMMMRYNEASTDVNGQIAVAVAKAVDEKAMEMEADFAEREKDPYRDFAGPADYGQLSFEYPKTWSVYIESDASKGGNFVAYFNPIEVNPVSSDTINALRVIILDKDFEAVTADYQRQMEKKDANLSVQSVTVNGISANYYSGRIPNTDLNGYILIFKIRDKTAIMQTDSVLFADDFNRLIETITFNA